MSVASNEKLADVTPVLRVTVQPEKSTMALTSGPAQFPKVPLVDDTSDKSTGEESLMTGLPAASSTSTTGWSAVSKAVPEAKVADVDGNCRKTSFEGTVPTAPWEPVLSRGYWMMSCVEYVPLGPVTCNVTNSAEPATQLVVQPFPFHHST